jgi:glycosyltransferase involved in cell wall biosynthesis
MSSTAELSVIILCYRSGESLIGFFEEVKKIIANEIPSHEFILVANYLQGSDDKTGEIAKKLGAENKNCTVLSIPKKGMMGWDMRQGLDTATGEVLCVIDGDGQFPISSILDCYQLMEKENLDLVKTYRETRNDSIYRRIISTAYNLIFKLLFPGLNSKDVNSKPKLLRSSAYEKMKLTSDDWFVDAEIMLNVRDHKMSFKEIPVEFDELKGRKSFVKPQAIIEFLINMVRYRLKNSTENP